MAPASAGARLQARRSDTGKPWRDHGMEFDRRSRSAIVRAAAGCPCQ